MSKMTNNLLGRLVIVDEGYVKGPFGEDSPLGSRVGYKGEIVIVRLEKDTDLTLGVLWPGGKVEFIPARFLNIGNPLVRSDDA